MDFAKKTMAKSMMNAAIHFPLPAFVMGPSPFPRKMLDDCKVCQDEKQGRRIAPGDIG